MTCRSESVPENLVSDAALGVLRETADLMRQAHAALDTLRLEVDLLRAQKDAMAAKLNDCEAQARKLVADVGNARDAYEREARRVRWLSHRMGGCGIEVWEEVFGRWAGAPTLERAVDAALEEEG